MKLHPAGRRYLRTIDRLHQKSGRVRQCNIAKELGYSKPSVSSMIGRLSAQGYVCVQDRDVCLTRDGLKCVQELRTKYEVICNFWMEILGIDGATAAREAEQLTQVIGMDTLRALQQALWERRMLSDDSPAGKMAD